MDIAINELHLWILITSLTPLRAIIHGDRKCPDWAGLCQGWTRGWGWGLYFQLTLDSRNAEKVAAWHYKTVDVLCAGEQAMLTIGDRN